MNLFLKKKLIFRIFFNLAVILLCGLTIFYNTNFGLHLNNPSKMRYPVIGIDVSHYQGDIDWNIIAKQDISFAFIKATEGSTYTDSYFKKNYEEARGTSIRVGAYHFFSFESDGISQAANFIRTVSKFDEMLPPVVDVEFYRDFEKNPPDAIKIQKELLILLQLLEDFYNVNPIIYATEKTYKLYISGDMFSKYDIWIRNVIKKPSLSDHRKWTFWQYTFMGSLPGFNGDENFIDLNVFNGSKKDFDSYGYSDLPY